MLVLSRKEGEQILIGDNITLTIVKSANGQVKVGIQAPSNVKVLRAELNQTKPNTETPTTKVS